VAIFNVKNQMKDKAEGKKSASEIKKALIEQK
jgi:hypothetical protein